MGLLEIILAIAVALKMAGISFLTTSYIGLVGYYVLGYVAMFAAAVVIGFIYLVAVSIWRGT